MGAAPTHTVVQHAAANEEEGVVTGAIAPKTVERGANEFSLEGLIRDERGVRLAPEGED